MRRVSLFYRVTRLSDLISFFFFNDTATTEIYTLSLHDTLPISCVCASAAGTPVHITSTSTIAVVNPFIVVDIPSSLALHRHGRYVCVPPPLRPRGRTYQTIVHLPIGPWSNTGSPSPGREIPCLPYRPG